MVNIFRVKCLCLCAILSAAITVVAADLPRDHGVAGGLAVVVGSTDGAVEADLAAGGTLLVQGLAGDDAALAKARAAIQARGLYGVATVVRPAAFSPLPYADNLINLLVVDGDALGAKAPAAAEISRVLAPLGVALVRRGGTWAKTLKPRPEGIDDWTHFDYDAGGTGVSHDTQVRPPNHVQWRLEVQEYNGLGGNPAAYRPYTGFRIAGGRAFCALYTGKAGDKNAPVLFTARDASNGVPLWSVPGFSAGSGTPQEYQFAVSADRVFCFLARDGAPVALDAATGKTLITYDQAGPMVAAGSKASPGYVMLRHAAGLLVVANGERLICLDAVSGAAKWTHHEAGLAISAPKLYAKERRVIAIVAASGESIQGRWANFATQAILCLDLDSGKPLWRSTELKDNRLGQCVLAGGKVFAYCPDGIGAGDAWKHKVGKTHALDAATGKLLWSGEHYDWGYNLIVRDGTPFFAQPATINRIDPEVGKFAPFWTASYNNRCNRTSATGDWLIMGLGIYVDKEGTATVRSIARSGCAQGAFPGNGLIYFTPNTCSCFTQLRGHLALSAEPVRAALPDGQRLEPGGGSMGSAKPTALSGLIAGEWAVQVNQGALETPPMADGARSLVAVTHEHRLECREGAKVVWSFTAGGRISQPPVVHDGRVLFGSHDGRVYCLAAADGALQWRFLAAPSERQLVSHGQVESSWPVYNVVIHDGKACAVAGLHPETGGGMFVWGLDPRTGAIAWRKLLKRSEVVGASKLAIAPNRVLASPLRSEGGKLAIVGLSFAVDETEADLQKRIDTMSLKDANRNLGWSPKATPVKGK